MMALSMRARVPWSVPVAIAAVVILLVVRGSIWRPLRCPNCGTVWRVVPSIWKGEEPIPAAACDKCGLHYRWRD